MITPFAGPSAGASIDAVTLNDRFLMSMTLPSLSRFIPGNSTWLVPVISCGRPAMVALSRSNRRSSIGSTLYFTASISHSRCSFASRSGCSAARSRAWDQSVLPS